MTLSMSMPMSPALVFAPADDFAPAPDDSPNAPEGVDPATTGTRTRPRRVRTGLSPSRRDLADRYIPLARSLSRRFKRSCPGGWEEFESGSMLALVEAAEAFDPDRGVKFATFARRRITGALIDVQRALFARSRPGGGEAISGPLPAFREHFGGRVLGVLADQPIGWELETHDVVERLVATLPPREAEACRRLYLRGQSQSEAAAELGLSQSRLCRIHRVALARLRLQARARDLTDAPLDTETDADTDSDSNASANAA